MKYLWILPVIINYILPVDCVPANCEECTCSFRSQRPELICERKGLREIPTGMPARLMVLNLPRNDITSIDEDAFQGLEELETINLTRNKIRYIHPRAFRNLFRLQTLVLMRNEITTIQAPLLQHLPQISEITFSNNNIKTISRYAFVTLPIHHQVIVRLANNPVECNCEILALRNWQNERSRTNLDIEDLSCANADGTSYTDVKEDQFDCDSDESPEVFPEDQECPICQGSPAPCRNSPKQSCFSDSDVPGMCLRTLQFLNGQVNESRSCKRRPDCMKYELENSDRCLLSRTLGPGLVCYYCCVGELCNSTDIGGRFKSYSFYLTLEIANLRYSPELNDPSSDIYQEYKQKVEGAMLELLTNLSKMGIFSVPNIAFSAPGLAAHVHLKARMLVQTSEVPQAVNTGLRKGMEASSSVNGLVLTRLTFSVTEPLFCPLEVQNTTKGTFPWPKTREGATVTATCPMPDMAPKILSAATRKCNKFGKNAIWQDPNLDQCRYTSTTTRNLEYLANQDVTDENVLSVSRQLENLTSKTTNFTQEDVDFAVDIVQKIVQTEGSWTQMEVINNTLACASSIINVPSDVLLKAEQMKQATSRLITSVDTMSTKANLDGGDLVLIQPNLAVAAVGVNPRNFSGVSFTTSQSTAQNNSLAPGEVKIKKGKRSMSEVIAEKKSTIILPDSLFKSTVSSVDITRITFALYPTDKVFSVFEEARQGPTVNPTGRSGPSMAPGNLQMLPTGPFNTAAYNKSNEQTITDGNRKFVRKINSLILAAAVPNAVISNLTEPVVIHLMHLKGGAQRPECVFWRENSVAWSSEGCQIREHVGDSYTTCTCTHLTNFALLMDVYEGGTQIPEGHKLALSLISYVGCGVSLIALVLTLLTYLLFRKLRRDNPSKILINLCIALAVANLVFLVGMQDYTLQNDAACKSVAVLLHYFMLSALMWMAVEAFYMYLALVLVFKTYFTNFILKCCLIGWGIPLVIVILTFGINSTDNYALLDSGICWLRTPAFYGAFLGPVAVILLINFIAFGLVLRQILGRSSQKLNKSDKTSTATQLRGAFGVVILLGLAWVFAIFAIEGANLVFYYLFAITNSLQGLFIFIFYCVFKKDALRAWRQKLPCCQALEEKSGERSSGKDQNIRDKKSEQEQVTLLTFSPGYSTPASNSSGSVKNTSSTNGSSDSSAYRQRGQAYNLPREAGSGHVTGRFSTSI